MGNLSAQYILCGKIFFIPKIHKTRLIGTDSVLLNRIRLASGHSETFP